jgi:hypothetical protein
MGKAQIRVLFVATVILLLGMSQNLPAQLGRPRDPGYVAARLAPVAPWPA